eukprot:5257932-Amphidinium_carterae.1
MSTLSCQLQKHLPGQARSPEGVVWLVPRGCRPPWKTIENNKRRSVTETEHDRKVDEMRTANAAA